MLRKNARQRAARPYDSWTELMGDVRLLDAFLNIV